MIKIKLLTYVQPLTNVALAQTIDLWCTPETNETARLRLSRIVKNRRAGSNRMSQRLLAKRRKTQISGA
jgi:hypothetical protein